MSFCDVGSSVATTNAHAGSSVGTVAAQRWDWEQFNGPKLLLSVDGINSSRRFWLIINRNMFLCVCVTEARCPIDIVCVCVIRLLRL